MVRASHHISFGQGVYKGTGWSNLVYQNQGTRKLIAQIYVDDIIFGATLHFLAHEFSEEMKQEFEMSMIGELNYFIALQVKQTTEGIFISKSKYAKDLVKRFSLDRRVLPELPWAPVSRFAVTLQGNQSIHLYTEVR